MERRMAIAFFTEMGFTGKVPRTHDNMRTEFAWMCALDELITLYIQHIK